MNNWIDLFPVTAKIDSSSGLKVGGHSLFGLAHKWGTPLYVYDGATVHRQVDYLKSLLHNRYPGESEIAYAAKAYFSLGFARLMRQMDIGVDVVSQGELSIALQAGFEPRRMHLHGNNKSQDEFMLAMEQGIQAVVVDSLEELAFLEKLAKNVSKRVRIWLRVTPGIDVNTHPKIQTAHRSSKFGLHVVGGEAAEGILIAKHSKHLDLKGLHIHLGSQIFDPTPYQEAVNILLDLAEEQNFIPEEISTGGGWGVPYHPGMERVDADLWVGSIAAEIINYYGKKGRKLPKLIVEPGRWLVAQAAVALYTIGTTKLASDGTYYISVDGGMADNPRPALYQARYTAVLVQKPDTPAVRWAVLAGKYCETGDQLIDEIQLPEVKRGDVVAMPVAGAYQLSMASNYNLSARPAVLWLENGKTQLIQKREIPDRTGWWIE